jgi:hypothetical protein
VEIEIFAILGSNSGGWFGIGMDCKKKGVKVSHEGVSLNSAR